MTKEFSFTARKDKDGVLRVQGNEQLKNNAGKPVGNIASDLSDVVSDSEVTAISALLVSLQALLEAQ